MSESKKEIKKDKVTQKEEQPHVAQMTKPVGTPGFNGILPHGAKKEGLGPNTKR